MQFFNDGIDKQCQDFTFNPNCKCNTVVNTAQMSIKFGFFLVGLYLSPGEHLPKRNNCLCIIRNKFLFNSLFNLKKNYIIILNLLHFIIVKFTAVFIYFLIVKYEKELKPKINVALPIELVQYSIDQTVAIQRLL